MFERLSRSWQLVKASGSVLRQDKELLLFPLISSFATLAVVACFLVPLFGLGALDGLGGKGPMPASMYVVGFLFYVCQYFVIFYFNAALVGAAMVRLDGGNPTLGDGLRIANSKAVNILAYAAIAATVGMILRAIQERVGFLGKIVTGIIGAGWTLATSMVVPILVSRDIGPMDAVKESAMLLKKTWGENIAGQMGIGAAFTLIQLAIIVTGVALIVAAAVMGSATLAIILGALLVVSVIVTALTHAALSGIYSAALYRYASSGESSAGFDSAVLQQAFLPKK
ncbi:DUF6159 family protein [Casimicrobium huifangae]|uniref:DUF6159 family protein n=1 Tax=Casimicrobium huifangae TaxID=2591109 RepID=UPI0037840EA3